MKLRQAKWIADIIRSTGFKTILEIGFFHGVSTCYLAAAIAPLGGHVTAIDIPFSSNLQPPAEDLLRTCGLQKFVTLEREPTGAAWHLMKLIASKRQFDLCFIDDNHRWSVTGF